MITPKDLLEVIKFKNAGVKHICPHCGNQDWNIDPDVYNEVPSVITTICTGCGLMRLYNTKILLKGKISD